MTLKDFLIANPSLIEGTDKRIIQWVFSNKKDLAKLFKTKFVKSPYYLVVQIPTKKGTKLIKMISAQEIMLTKTLKLSYLTWSSLSKMYKKKLIN